MLLALSRDLLPRVSRARPRMRDTIDTGTYDKAKTYPLAHGYERRMRAPTSIVVHSTEGVVGQSLSSAADYLYRSAKVSAHYLIGKGSEIIQFLDPHPYAAWHAGQALAAYSNQRSIGIECLHARGEAWPEAQRATLAWLLQHLVATYHIASTAIDTHGQIALPGPYDRKLDPTNWPHSEFIVWRDSVLATPREYRAGPFGAIARQDRRPEAIAAKYYAPGELFRTTNVQDGYAWDMTGIGFVALGDLEG